MTMDASGGSSAGSYHINWTASGGFTGTGWEIAWNAPNVPLKNAWTNSPPEGYADANGQGTYNTFLNYLATGVDDLSTWLDNAGWTNDQKYEFAHDHYPTIWMNCTGPA